MFKLDKFKHLELLRRIRHRSVLLQATNFAKSIHMNLYYSSLGHYSSFPYVNLLIIRIISILFDVNDHLNYYVVLMSKSKIA